MSRDERESAGTTTLPARHQETLARVREHFSGELIAGAYIPPETVEKIVGESRESAKYSLAVIRAATAIEAFIELQTDRTVWVRRQDSGLRVLTGKEASTHGLEMVERHFDSAHRLHTKTGACVSYDDFDDEDERKRFYERHERQSRVLHRMNVARLEDIPGGADS